MLQQTRTETVIPYYERFITRFPDVYHLAQAHIDEVLKYWEGLGYYARARHLHKAAVTIMNNWHGELPRKPSQLQSIPGIGPYTAAAIASIAYGEPVPVVDGNVLRVVTRLFGVHDDIRRETTKQQTAALLSPYISRENPSAFNQALMDIGATICSPRKPACGSCPLSDACIAYAHDLTETVPVKSPSAPVPEYRVAVALVRWQDRILIGKRPTDKMLGGLWELPGGKLCKEETPIQAVKRELREETGLQIRVVRQYQPVHHAYTHFRVVLHPFECKIVTGAATAREHTEVRWIPLSELDSYAFPRGTQKIFRRIGIRD